MNRRELDEIEARSLALDVRDWSEETDEDGEEWIRIPGGHDIQFWNIEVTDKCCYDVISFISHAHKDIPNLIAEVRRLRAAIAESIADVRGAQFTDNTWKEAEAEKRGILAGLENALKGGDK